MGSRTFLNRCRASPPAPKAASPLVLTTRHSLLLAVTGAGARPGALVSPAVRVHAADVGGVRRLRHLRRRDAVEGAGTATCGDLAAPWVRRLRHRPRRQTRAAGAMSGAVPARTAAVGGLPKAGAGSRSSTGSPIRPTSVVLQFTRLAAERLANRNEAELARNPGLARTFNQMRLKPTQYRCASEARLRRFRKEGQLPLIHPLVDLCNALSIADAWSVLPYRRTCSGTSLVASTVNGRLLTSRRDRWRSCPQGGAPGQGLGCASASTETAPSQDRGGNRWRTRREPPRRGRQCDVDHMGRLQVQFTGVMLDAAAILEAMTADRHQACFPFRSRLLARPGLNPA